MEDIGRGILYLESCEQNFVVEALSSNLDPKLVKEVLRDAGKESKRKRCLPAAFTVWFVILMGLYRRVSYANLLEKLDDTWWTRKHWKSEKPPTSSAVTRARDRIGVEPVKKLYEETAGEWVCATEGCYVAGRRVYALDGSNLKTPDTPENAEAFGYPGASRGSAAYPQMRLMAIEDVGSRIVDSFNHGPYRKGEMTLARELLPKIPRNSIVLMDKNFLAYEFLWDIDQRGEKFVVRQKDSIKPRVIKTFGPGDELVEVTIPRYFRKRRPDMPRTWALRRITYRVEGMDEEFRLFTNLTDPQEAKKEHLGMLYHDRWEEETTLDEIKTHLCDCTTVNRPVVFRSKKPERVIQELYGLMIAYNAVRKTMADAARGTKRSAKRLSFTASIERIREAIWDMMRLHTDELPQRHRRLFKVIARAHVPFRPGRKYPRAVKIKMSGYPLKQRRQYA